MKKQTGGFGKGTITIEFQEHDAVDDVKLMLDAIDYAFSQVRLAQELRLLVSKKENS